MASRFKISVEEPCNQKFNAFSPTKEGGFCSACQKEVVDFTGMTESEIRAYFMDISKQKGTCGRFRKDQLGAYSAAPTHVKRKYLSLPANAGIAGVSLLTLLPTNEGSSQPEEMVSINIPREQPNTLTAAAPGDTLLNGTVTDAETGEGIPFVNIVLKGSSTGTTTDMDGYFQFPTPLSKGDTLTFTYLDYEKTEFIFTDETSIEIALFESAVLGEVVIIGEVSRNEPYSSRRSFWEKLKAFFR